MGESITVPAVRRPRLEPTDDWQQLQLLAPFPEQRAYELLRPVVLFGHSPAERAVETGTAERTLYRRAARFDAEGMVSLFPPPKVEKHQRLPAPVQAAIRDLKAEHPVFRASEIADICAIRFDHRPSPHTVKRILAEDPPPARAARRFPPYREIADPSRRASPSSGCTARVGRSRALPLTSTVVVSRSTARSGGGSPRGSRGSTTSRAPARASRAR